MAAVADGVPTRKSPIFSPERAKARLRKLLLGCLILIGLPVALVIGRAYTQLEHETLYQYRVSAEQVIAQLNQRLFDALKPEEDRAFDDYHFFKVADGQRGVFELSPLASLSAASRFPGLAGYFQIEPNGGFSTPLVPDAIPPSVELASFGVTPAELERRRQLRRVLLDILSSTALIGAFHPTNLAPGTGTQQGQVSQSASPATVVAQSPSLLPPSANVASQLLEQRVPRKSVVNMLESSEVVASKKEERAPLQKGAQQIKVTRFEAEIDPFQMMLLPDKNLAFFRKVWRNEQRFIQGFVVDREKLFRFLVEASFYTSALSRDCVLTLRHGGGVLARYEPTPASRFGPGISNAIFWKASLSPPLNDLELTFSAGALSPPTGRTVLHLFTALISLVLVGGLIGVYRLAVGQVEMAAQRTDFVSAVSHELKTPLTSIRMYAEMLKSGMGTDPAKRKTYLDYILSESERLSRLISNVLQLARLSRASPEGLGARAVGEVREFRAPELLEVAREKVASQVQAAGFQLVTRSSPDATGLIVAVEEDCFVQIFINLVDNALKFSAQSERKVIEIGLDRGRPAARAGCAVFSVRDYGPGVPKDQMRKIFNLFYRAED